MQEEVGECIVEEEEHEDFVLDDSSLEVIEYAVEDPTRERFEIVDDVVLGIEGGYGNVDAGVLGDDEAGEWQWLLTAAAEVEAEQEVGVGVVVSSKPVSEGKVLSSVGVGAHLRDARRKERDLKAAAGFNTGDLVEGPGGCGCGEVTRVLPDDCWWAGRLEVRASGSIFFWRASQVALLAKRTKGDG